MGFLFGFVSFVTFNGFLVQFGFVCYISAFKSFFNMFVSECLNGRAKEYLVVNNKDDR